MVGSGPAGQVWAGQGGSALLGTLSSYRQFAALGGLCRALEHRNHFGKEKTASPPSGPRENRGRRKDPAS